MNGYAGTVLEAMAAVNVVLATYVNTPGTDPVRALGYVRFNLHYDTTRLEGGRDRWLMKHRWLTA